MKYMVKFSCGHEHEVELCGKYNERERRIKWYEESGICENCKEAAKASKLSATCKEVEMHYSEYKNNYAECETKSGSYNKATKTIIVYVPRPTEEPTEIFEDEVAQDDAEDASDEIVFATFPKYEPDPDMADFINSMERVDFNWDDIPDIWADDRKIVEREDGTTEIILLNKK